LIVNQQTAAQKKVDELYATLGRRRGASPFGSCPVNLTASFVQLCLAQSCGKCVPCRVGLDRLHALLEKILDGRGTTDDLRAVRRSAAAIYDSADCAIGFEAARLVLEAFRDDYMSHIENGVCTAAFDAVPCVAGCPANVDVPGYIALIREERYADAVRLIRKDNPFPGVCGLICEHPCEKHCRRQIVDDSINIRGLKRYAVERAGIVPTPPCAPFNGKTVAVIGGGPAGLTAAYYLQLKGYHVTVFEKHKRLGGMLRYGIPAYRLPRERLDEDINAILAVGGIEVRLETKVDTQAMAELQNEFDAVYVAIGAQKGKGLRIDGAKAEGVISAVDLLGRIGDGDYPDFSGKRVAVIGGGNVAMDCVRTAVRAGADEVSCVYRRRVADMTALDAEIESAIAEGVEMITLESPDSIETNEAGQVVALITQPQMISAVKGGRPSVKAADKPKRRIEADVILVAVGQGIESQPFEDAGMLAERIPRSPRRKRHARRRVRRRRLPNWSRDCH